MWSSVVVYSMLRLRPYSGQGSKWAYRSLPGWSQFMARLGFSADDHFLSSTHAVHDGQITDKSCLPWPGMSTTALGSLLCRWSSSTPPQGGFRDIAARSAARFVSEGLLRGCCLGKAAALDSALATGMVEALAAPGRLAAGLRVGGVARDAVGQHWRWQSKVDAGEPLARQWWYLHAWSEASLGELRLLLLLGTLAQATPTSVPCSASSSTRSRFASRWRWRTVCRARKWPRWTSAPGPSTFSTC